MHWEAGYEYPWAVLTDLDPEQAEVSWYGMRTWIETGYKDFSGRAVQRSGLTLRQAVT